MELNQLDLRGRQRGYGLAIEMTLGAASIRLLICGIDQLDEYCTADISHIVSILDPGCAEPDIFRLFAQIERLDLRFHDIIDEHAGMVAPNANDIERLLEFGRSTLDSRSTSGLLVHCHAGLSRSTAAAVLLLAQAQPDRPPETAVIEMLELKPRAWPNLRMIELGDESLRCEGKLIRAVRRHYADMVERFPMLRHAVASGRHLPDGAELPPPAAEVEV
jgi:predicted protein tyrosine phosphatase